MGLKTILIFVSLGAAICSILGVFGKAFWFFDLFSHFRPQAVLSSIFLLGLSWKLNHRPMMFLNLGTVTLNVFLILHSLSFFPAAGTSVDQKSGDSLSLYFANIYKLNQNYSKITESILSQDQDIVLLTELSPLLEKELSSLTHHYPHHFSSPRDDSAGAAFFSKNPFHVTTLKVGENQIPLYLLKLKDIAILMVHPLPPISHESHQDILECMEEIKRIIAKTTTPIVILGDFNTTILSSIIHPLRHLGLQRTNTLGIGWTWPTYFLPLGIQLDQIFVKGVHSASFKVLPNIGSDHYPIASTLIY